MGRNDGGEREISQSDLGKLCDLRGDLIRNLRSKLKGNVNRALEIAEGVYVARAIEDEELSYVVVADSGRIVASTEGFRKKFHFDDSNKPIVGRPYFRVIKSPPDSPGYIHDLKKLFRDSSRIEVQTTICDGEGNEKFVHLLKYEPYRVDVFPPGDEEVQNRDYPPGDEEVKNRDYPPGDEEVKNRDYFFYTRVDVHEIGWVKREVGIARRFLHIPDGVPLTVPELLAKRAIEAVKKEADAERDKILSSPSGRKKERKKKKSK
ncbi:hypothetical protein A3K73_07205 [Candidatus Pacearchaeota archaeon RBG_13_36_9]|nr:MAG: hypothetical protein A3K73_07205 [Candidatus Pacearchaeota archaeon RBG_13_36_9]